MRTAASTTALLVVSACGRISFGPVSSDGNVDDAVAVRDDGAIDAGGCTGSFMAPQVVAATVTAADEWGGGISPDGLELYFGSNRNGGAGGYDIYRSTRASRSEAFGAPERVVEIATPADEDNPFITSDGLELWFDRARKLMRATRVDRMSPWQSAQPVAELNDPDVDIDDVSPTLHDDLLAVYFASQRLPSAGNFDLFMATRATRAEPFGAPVSLAVNSAAFECCPYLTSGGNQLMFTTNGIAPANGIAIVALDAAGLPTGPATLEPSLDTSGEELDVFETLDGAIRGYSYRPTLGTGDFDIYLMERSCP